MKVAKNIQSSHMFFTQLLLMSKIYIGMAHLSKLENQYQCNTISLTPGFIHISPVFPLLSFCSWI